MKEIIINNYLNRLNLNDMDIFLKNNNIYLDSEQTNNLYKYIKTNNKKILYGDLTDVIADLSNFIDTQNINKLKTLYFYYKQKYGHYL